MRVRPPIMEAITGVSFTVKAVVDFDERIMGHIKVEAPTFDGRLDPWAFTKWVVTWTTSLSGTIY